jgi:predicted DNA-binding transcriptional regulator AlpA
MTTGHGMLKTAEAAQFLGVAPQTLNKWRCHKTGPKYVKLAHYIWYREADLREWIEASVITPTKSA